MSQFLCLLPVYNHQQYLTESAVQSFLDQSWIKDKPAFSSATLLIGDDRPEGQQLDYADIPNVLVYRMPARARNLPDKYNQMLAQAARLGLEYDAVALWDDDDLYLSQHLEQAAAGLELEPYTWPKFTYDAHSDEVMQIHTAGRFWASMTIRRAALERIGGFTDDSRLVFDQAFMHKLHSNFGSGYRGETPTYLYRWSGTGDVHASTLSSNPNDTTWWSKCVAADCVGPLKPQYDPNARHLLSQVASLEEVL